MPEHAKSKEEFPPGASASQRVVPLESILCTEELRRRPSRPPDYENENRSLVKLVSALADSPRTIFQTLADTILEVTQGDSAGLSLLTRDGKTPDVRGERFYWPAIAGMWNPHVGGGTPRNFGPCGDVLNKNCTLLFTHFERRYPYLVPVSPAAEECLLVPFYVAGKAVGTIWSIMHSDRRRFDAEDDRVMASLGKFASSAYQALKHIEEDLKIQAAEREKAEAEVRAGIGIALARKDSLRAILNLCAKVIVQHLDATFVRIWTLNRDGRELELQASAGLYTRLDGSYSRIPLGRLKIGYIAQEGKPHLTNDVQNDPQVEHHDWARAENITSFAGYPLIVEDRIVGVMGMFSRKPLTQETFETLTFISDGIAQCIERKQAEDQLRRSEAKVRRLVEANVVGIVMWNFEGTIVEANEAFLHMLQYSGEDLSSGRVRWKDLTPAEWRDRDERAIAEMKASSIFQPFEKEYFRKDGSRVPVLLGGTLLERGGDEGVAFVLDLSERKRAETALQETQTELFHVTRLTTMGELVASIAHEINQPLAAIVANGEACLRWLKAEPPNVDEARKCAGRMIKDGGRASEVIKGIRGLARKSTLELAPVHLNQLIEEVIAVVRGEIQRSRVLLKTELTPDLPMVLGDRVQLQQVVLNLILNGMEAMSEMPSEQRSLVIGSGRNDPDGVVVYVRDRGVGIGTEAMQDIFEPFFTTKPEGTGMGLSISRSIVEAHGGRLWADPNQDRGMTFSFSVPGVPNEGKRADRFCR